MLKRKQDSSRIYVKGQPIEIVKVLKYLGKTINDSRITFRK